MPKEPGEKMSPEEQQQQGLVQDQLFALMRHMDMDHGIPWQLCMGALLNVFIYGMCTRYTDDEELKRHVAKAVELSLVDMRAVILEYTLAASKSAPKH